MAEKLFSVIIIYYNSERFVKESVESVLNQTCTDFELILVNDGSKDKTGEICNSYAEKDPRVVVINKENGGISDARNAGIARATGKYILLIDGDDYIDKNGLQTFRDLIEESDYRVDYVFGKMSYFYEETNEIYQVQHNLETDCVKGMNGRDAFVAMYKKDGRISMGVRGAFRREFLSMNNIKFPGRFFEDVNVIMQVMLKADYVMVNTADYYYFRNRKDSTSKQYSISRVDEIYEEMLWWNQQLEMVKYDEEFEKCVRLEIDRRIKQTIKKYVVLLKEEELNELVELINKNNQLFYPKKNIVWKFWSTNIGIKILRQMKRLSI